MINFNCLVSTRSLQVKFLLRLLHMRQQQIRGRGSLKLQCRPWTTSRHWHEGGGCNPPILNFRSLLIFHMASIGRVLTSEARKKSCRTFYALSLSPSHHCSTSRSATFSCPCDCHVNNLRILASLVAGLALKHTNGLTSISCYMANPIKYFV
jgi:hypothetical protein